MMRWQISSPIGTRDRDRELMLMMNTLYYYDVCVILMNYQISYCLLYYH